MFLGVVCLRDNFLPAELHLPVGTIREKDNPRRHLFGKPKYVGRVSTRWLEANGIPYRQGSGDGIRRGSDYAEHRVFPRGSRTVRGRAGAIVPFALRRRSEDSMAGRLPKS